MPNYRDFTSDLLKMLGLQDRHIKKLVLTCEANTPPIIETVEYLYGGAAETINRTYRLTEDQI